MLREWTGNSFVTRDHCNFNYRVTFPIAMAVSQAAETRVAEEPVKQVARQAQSTGDAVAAAQAGAVAPPVHEDTLPVPRDIEQRCVFNELKQFIQRLWAWFKGK